MRQPVTTIPPGVRPNRITSAAVAFSVDIFRQQPGTTGADGTTPIGALAPVRGTLEDDSSQAPARTLTVDIAKLPDWLEPGMWMRPSIGIQTIQNTIYRLPTCIITDVAVEPSDSQLGTLTGKDPGEVLNNRPYEADTTLTGTLRSLVQSACSVLTRPTNVSAVPAITIPKESIAEFGAGRWDTCLDIADALGVALRFTDDGDVIGRIRSGPFPEPMAIIELIEAAGSLHKVRWPTTAKVLVDRGDITGLVGVATSQTVTGIAAPSWYPPYVITDSQQGDSTTTQTAADQLAYGLLVSKLAELDFFDSLPILPSPWLEAGADVVDLRSRNYGVRAITIDLPSLATQVTLRRIPL